VRQEKSSSDTVCRGLVKQAAVEKQKRCGGLIGDVELNLELVAGRYCS